MAKKQKLGKPITLTRKQFEKIWGAPAPEWLWQYLRNNNLELKKKKKNA